MTNTHKITTLVTLALLTAIAPALTACDPAPEEGVLLEQGDFVEGEDYELVEFEVIAALAPDEDTSIVFTREPAGEGRFAVGTKIIGPASGVAYERLIAEQGLSPLEVFVSLAAPDEAIPAALQESHDAVVRAQERESDELRALELPRAISTLNSVYCDSYQAFQDHINNTWTNTGHARDRVISNSTQNHSVFRYGWHAAYGSACNADDTSSDEKNVLMCSRPEGSVFFSCEIANLPDGYRGYKTWSAVYTGNGTWQEFDYQVTALNVGSSQRRSYIGLIVAAWIG